MYYTTVSSKFQVVIPKEIRRELKLKPGQKLCAWLKNGHIRLIPVKPIRYYCGILKGVKINMNEIREEGEDEDLKCYL